MHPHPPGSAIRGLSAVTGMTRRNAAREQRHMLHTLQSKTGKTRAAGFSLREHTVERASCVRPTFARAESIARGLFSERDRYVRIREVRSGLERRAG